MSRFEVDLPFGAQILADGRTRFRLWVPSARSVSLELEGGAPLAMARDRAGVHTAFATCGAGARYRYRPDTGQDGAPLAVPDPASRAQPDGVHGPSLVVDPKTYAWRCADWRGRAWETAVIYEAHAGLMGGFEGVEAALSHLADLGVTTIELMPIAAVSGRRNWGYDGVLPFAPAAAYGAPEDLKRLIDRAHELGLMMILDVVYNHFGPDGNYIAAYAPQMFREDVHTPWGGAIDFRRPEVRDYFTSNAIYWLNEYRFDGLRLDAVHAIGAPDWLQEMAWAVRAAVGPERHVHLILENEHNAASLLGGPIDAQWNDDFHNVLHVMLTGETGAYYQDFADRPAERLARCLAEGFIYQGEASANHDGAPRGEPSAGLPPTAFVAFLQNHDQVGNRALGERLIGLADRRALKAATALLLLCPQIPLVFMGEEVGSETPFLFFTDFHDELAQAVREGRRQEFAKFPAFSNPDARATIPDPNDPVTFDRSRPLPGPDAAETFAFYRELLALRRNWIAPRLKGARASGAEVLGPKAVIARWRLGDGANLTIALNLAADAVPIDDVPAAEPLYCCGAALSAGKLGGDLGGFSFIAWVETAA
jgi:malto-oligosyltrehalose trehalohydrolase